jgi:metal-dependent amidase/aminoacylase/carboxypeptidase family protein
MRQQLRPDARIHGIITSGGQAPNVIPDLASARFLVRALDMKYLGTVIEKFEGIVKGAALATGAKYSITWSENVFMPLNTNKALAGRFKARLLQAGLKLDDIDPGAEIGSSDIGNLSWLVPAIQPSIAITPRGVPGHSIALRQAAASAKAIGIMLKASLAMALTGLDYMADPGLRADVRSGFVATRKLGRM